MTVNGLFIVHLALVGFISIGLISRQWVFLLLGLWLVFIFLKPLEDSADLFIRTIPFFIALPFVSYFDNFNMWRIVSGLIFLKFVSQYKNDLYLLIKKFLNSPKEYPITLSILLLFLISLFSLIISADVFIGAKRIIYFVNLLLMPMMLFWLLKQERLNSSRILKSIAISAFIITGIGFIQLVSTYLLTPDDFLRFWALDIQGNYYGREWGSIAYQANTWLAYFGEQFSLRMFSVFPDSHTFPMYLIMSLPAVAILITNGSWLIAKKTKIGILLLATRYLLLAGLLLAIILSGTRGIWISFLAPIVFLLYLRKKIPRLRPRLKNPAMLILLFFLLFFLAVPIMGSDQFQLHKVDNDLLKQRLKSIVNFGETSNSGRIFIWKETLKSIVRRPVFGVGIGNFPIVLNQDPYLARAGSSAHNLYLNVFAELGIAAGAIFIYLLYLIIKRHLTILTELQNAKYDLKLIIYNLLTFSWIMLYSMSDAALFDERTFLLFGAIISLIMYTNKINSRL